MATETQIEKIKNIESEIIKDCSKILTKGNVIVYSTTNENINNQTDFLIYSMDENKLPKELIFMVYGPSAGYGLKIENPGILIDREVSGDQKQYDLMKLCSLAEKVFIKQRKTRSNIAILTRINSLTQARKNLAIFKGKER